MVFSGVGSFAEFAGNILSASEDDDEHVKVYEHEIALVDSLKENEVAVLCCHGNKKIAPWGELLSTRASYLKSAGCLTDGCVRDADMIREMNFPVFSKGPFCRKTAETE